MQIEEFNNPEYQTPDLKEKVETTLAETAPTPDNPPWNGWAAFGVWFASILFITVFSNIFLFAYMVKQPLDFSDSAKLIEFAKTDATAVLMQLIGIIPAHILTLALAWLVVTRLNKFSFRQTLGWKANGFKVWHAFLLFVAFYAMAILLVWLIGDVENDFEVMIRNSRTAVYFVAFFATFTAPLVEEVIYRGLLYSALQRAFANPKYLFFQTTPVLRNIRQLLARFPVVSAVLFVTFIFALVHVPQYSAGSTPDYATIITLLLLSLTLTLIRVWTGNLLPCIILHTVFNGVQSVLLLLEPYLPVDPVTTPEKTVSLIHWIT